MNTWTKEIWRLLALVFTGLTIGTVIDDITLSILIAVSLYLAWHLHNIYSLQTWLQRSGHPQPPQGSGIWMEIFDRIYYLQKQNRRGKKKLTRYLSRFKESTSAMPDATVVLNQSGQIEWINKAAQKLLGLKPSQDIGQHISNLMRTPEFIRYLTKGDFEQPLETHPPLNDQLHISVRIIPYGNNQSLFIARDVTRIKRLEQMRRDFVSNISHELRSPLTVLRGYLEAMQEDKDETTEMWQRSVEVMNQQTLRMQSVVDDLLMLSRMETGKAQGPQEDVPIPELLRAIQTAAQALGKEKEQEINLSIDDTLWLKGNYSELYSAFSNLVFNAVHYTPANGTITIEWLPTTEGARLKIQDTGIGIAPQHINRITERFYRVDSGRSRESGGTGLGLAIVKHVLQRHDGQLTVFSQVKRGSTFSCDFSKKKVIHHG
ncbi:phosphate regulon sensor histidine kinase PhoR [Pseudomonadota bacterium]